MTAKDAIRQSLQGSQRVLGMLLDDLSDADLLVRPAPNANHIAWQLGHLIATESRLLSQPTSIFMRVSSCASTS